MNISKQILYFTFLGTVLIGCSEPEHQDGEVKEIKTESTEVKEGNLSISGTMESGAGMKLYLYEYGSNQPSILDSTTVNPDNTFALNLTQNGYSFLGIGSQQENVALLLVGPDDQVALTGPAATWGMNYTVSGTGFTPAIREYLKLRASFTNEINLLKQELMALPKNDVAGQNAVNEKGFALQEKFIVKRDEFIQKMEDSPALYIALQDIYDPVSDIEKLKLIATATNKYLPNTIFAQQANDIKVQAEQQIALNEQMANVQPGGAVIGKPAPELNFPNPEGKNIALSSLKGNVVLLDFWASWCGPCRMENPNVVKLYNAYKDKGFTIYSVSLDNNKTKWLNAIQADGLIWPNHVSDLGGWNSVAAAIYGVNSIPQTYLIDANGIIIASGLRGEALAQKLKEILG